MAPASLPVLTYPAESAMVPRLHVATAFAAAAALVLPDATARHIRVLRLQPGSPVLLFNGDDGTEWSATVSRMTKTEVEVRLEAPHVVDRELPCAVTLALGAPANDRMDAFVEKACELGVADLQPLLCERSVLRLAGERAEAKRRHWSGIAASASEQCGRTRVATVSPVQGLQAWLDGAVSASRGHRVVLSLAADAAPASSLADVIAPAAAGEGDGERLSLVVLSGPEGGLTAAEEAAAVARGFVRIGLGPRVLRADTAPLALLAWLGLVAARRAP